MHKHAAYHQRGARNQQHTPDFHSLSSIFGKLALWKSGFLRLSTLKCRDAILISSLPIHRKCRAPGLPTKRVAAVGEESHQKKAGFAAGLKASRRASLR